MTDPHVVDPAHAPTPFTAGDIRRGCPAGREVTVKHTDSDGTTQYWTTTFARTGDRDAHLINQEVDEDGHPIGEASEFAATWDELQAHASFPVADTTIDTATLHSPLGELECLLYEVKDGTTTKRLWFARSLPGLPVKTVYLDEGRHQLTTLVVRDTQVEPRD